MAKRFLTPINLPSRTTDPATASNGDLYFNTSSNIIKVYYGSAWNAISGDSIIVSDTPPVGSGEGQLWYESDSGDLFIRYDDTWVQTGGGGGGGGGSSVLYQDDAPTSPAVGDIWVDANEELITLNSNSFMPKAGGTFTGSVTFSSTASGITPTLSAHLATKDYVDSSIAPPVESGLNPFLLGGM